MRVNYNFSDDFGQYDIEAEVSVTGKVNILNITDEYGTDIDIEDFSEGEVKQIGFLAKEAADNLDNSPEEEDEEELPDDY